jgi:predicted Zn-dependent peptidase
MITYENFKLENGLEVYVLPDHTTPLAVVNILYKVGARNEDPELTGFAHLFEHLMFGGSENVPDYDIALQRVGGNNNAFTSNDITNYYCTLPSANLETAFWLESDRMQSLSFKPDVLEVQRKVVIEEFKQRYLNQPYGDAWLNLRPLAYQKHPYRWATIGKEIKHIEEARMQDVKDFFFKYYRPNNAVMVVAGDVELDEVKHLTKKWFADITPGDKIEKNWPKEPVQTEMRKKTIVDDVPLKALYLTWHMPGRLDPGFYETEVLAEILGRGRGSRLYTQLVKQEELFSSIQAYITSSMDPGLFVVSGKLNPGISMEEGEKAIFRVIEELKGEIEDREMTAARNQLKTATAFHRTEILNIAMDLAYGASLGKPNLINEEVPAISETTLEGVLKLTNKILTNNNCSILYYDKD